MCTLAFSKIFKVSNIITFSYLIVIVMYLTEYDFRIEIDINNHKSQI